MDSNLLKLTTHCVYADVHLYILHNTKKPFEGENTHIEDNGLFDVNKHLLFPKGYWDMIRLWDLYKPYQLVRKHTFYEIS